MAVTTVVKTIGTTSRNFSTLQAWEDAAPANLTTAENSTAGTFSGGPFTQNETLNFVGSGATGKYLDSDNATYIVYGITTGDPAASDVVTGATSGATCVLSSSTPTGVGVIWQGQCYNDSQFTAKVVMSGSTTSSTCYLELTTAAGQSFQDNANVRTNALTYNQSNGVGIRNTTAYDIAVDLSANARISRIQIQTTTTQSNFAIRFTNGNVIKDCLIHVSGSYGLSSPASNPRTLIINTVIIQAGNKHGMDASAIMSLIGCTIVRTANQGTGQTAINDSGFSANCIMQSCCFFGFTTIVTTAGHWTSGSCFNNATDLASGLIGTSNQHSVTYNATTPFTQANAASNDMRSIAGTSLINNGFLDSTNAPNDISGTARSATPTIGHWEVAAAAAVVKTLAALGVG